MKFVHILYTFLQTIVSGSLDVVSFNACIQQLSVFAWLTPSLLHAPVDLRHLLILCRAGGILDKL